MKKLIWLLILCFSLAFSPCYGAYPTTTEHHKLYPYTSVKAAPYSCDNTGVLDIAASIELIKANQSSVGTIYFPHGTYKLATNLTIPAGVRIEREAGAKISIATGVVLTFNGDLQETGEPFFTLNGTAVVDFSSNTILNTFPLGTWPINSDTSFSRDFTIPYGCSFAVATGKTLTFTGSLQAGPYQIFSWTGTGKVTFGPGAVEEVYPQWFGAVNGTTDSAPAIAAAVTATPAGGIVRFTAGLWSIKTPLAITNTVSLRGSLGAYLWVDVGAGNDAITIGSVGTSRFSFEIDNLSVLGPANACKNAVVFIRNHVSSVKQLRICCGTVDYAAEIQGCIGGTYEIYVDYTYAPSGYGLTSVRAANGIKVTQIPGVYQTNQMWLKCHINLTTGNGLYIEGTDVTGTQTVLDVTGWLDGIGGDYSIYAYNAAFVRFHDMYVSEVNLAAHDAQFYFEKCKNMRFENLHAANSDFNFVNCQNVSLGTGDWSDIHLDTDCTGFKFGNIDLYTNATLGFLGKIYDDGQGTVYGGSIRIPSISPPPLVNKKSGLGDPQNLLENTNFERWQSDRPDSWNAVANQAWTKCGDGLADTTRHGTRYCAKSTNSVAAGGAISAALTIDADAQKQMFGQTCTFSIWVYHASGQNPTTYPFFRLKYVQGGVTKYAVITSGSTPLSAATDDAWTKVYGGGFIPADATSVALDFYQYNAGAGTTNDMYISEPCLWVNNGAATSFVRGRNDAGSAIMVSGIQIRADAYIPSNASSRYYTAYSRLGDVCWNDGSVTALTSGNANYWRCTVAGTPGTWIVGNTVP